MSTDLGTPVVMSPDEAERAVLLAAPRGYCAGVDRAVITVENVLDLYGSPVYVRKQIVTKTNVVANSDASGMINSKNLELAQRFAVFDYFVFLLIYKKKTI